MHCLRRVVARPSQCEGILKRLESSRAAQKIEIPSRIERGPTDILAALESTVKMDLTAPKYKYMDDPYLIPQTRVQLRSYAMAKEAGKKAAMWVHEEHADLFEKDIAVPEIPAFQPPEKYTDPSQVSEETLKKIIAKRDVKNAMNVYTLLSGNVSNGTKLSLLEMLCFYNSKENEFEELPEHRWIMKQTRDNNWVDEPIIQELFEYLCQQSPEEKAAAYSAYIAGLGKFFCVSKAWELFQLSKRDDIPLSLHAYNYMLALVPRMDGDNTKRVELVNYIFNRICAQGLKPNVNTLNSALRCANGIRGNMGIRLMLRLFADFKEIGVKPSLASYFYALNIITKNGANANAIFEEILNELEGQKIEIQDLSDTLFFTKAMEIAAESYNVELAERLHRIYLSNKNYKFINRSSMETVYYRFYLTAKLQALDVNSFFKVYNELIHVYVPETDFMEKILKTLGLNALDMINKYLPLLWTHVIQFNLIERPNILTEILQLTKNVDEILDQTQRVGYAQKTLTTWETLKELYEKRVSRLALDVKIITSIAVIFARADLMRETMNVLDFLSKNSNMLPGFITEQDTTELCNYFISNKNADGALILMEYLALMTGVSKDGVETAKHLMKNLELNKEQKRKLLHLFGSEVFETAEAAEEVEKES